MVKNSLFYLSFLLIFPIHAQQGWEQKVTSAWTWKKKAICALGAVAACGYMLIKKYKMQDRLCGTFVPDLGQIITSATLENETNRTSPLLDDLIDIISVNNFNNPFLSLPAEVQTHIANIVAERVRIAAAAGKTQEDLTQALKNYKAYCETHGQCRRAMLGTRLAQIYPYSEKNVPTPLQIIVADKRYSIKYLKKNVKRFSAAALWNKSRWCRIWN